MAGASRPLTAYVTCWILAVACSQPTTAAPVVVQVIVVPQAATCVVGGTIAFSATVTGTSDTAVTWTVQEGAAGGTISGAGVYTAPRTAGTYHVVATVAHATKTATATVTITDSAATTLPVADQLAELGARRTWFGHQSTGANLLVGPDYGGTNDGLAYLIASHPQCGVSVVNTVNGSAMPPGVFGHAQIGVNGNPAGKIDDFDAKARSTLRNGTPADLDFAFMKLCWIDFGTDGAIKTTDDADALFAHYRTVLDRLIADFPNVKFLHVTTPLRTAGHYYTGRGTNTLRERYNDAMRAYYPVSDILDVADWECAGADGRRVYTNPDGSGVFYDDPTGHVRALSTDWDSDGGHLDSAGSTYLATKLVEKLAAQAR